MFRTSTSPMTAVWLLLLLGAACAEFPFPVVKTTSGRVRGYYPEPNLRAFLGIPYAQPPVGSLRFKPPEPMEPKTNKVIDATEFGLSCYQFRVGVVTFASLSPSTGESEDCLTLNIWASESREGHPKPVLVWMYGGNFAEGSSSVPIYDMHKLAAAYPDVLVVTFNYRVNIFGFANSPAVPEKNVGLRDQRLAVEWLRDNIASFGGDPDRMILGGQSAGSMSTSLYAYAYPDDPIVRGLLMESGDATGVFPDNGTQWTGLTDALGCRSDNSSEELKCMQDVDAFTLKRTLSPEELTSISSPAQVRPTIDNVTYFGPATYATLGAAGKFAKIPAVRGITNNEGQLHSPFTPDGLLNQTLADWMTEYVFNCPNSAEANAWAAHDIPSWRYRYFGEFPSVAIYDWLKAYHGAEIPFLLGTTDKVRVRELEPYEVKAQKYLQQAMITFTKDPYHGLKDFGWPVYNPNTTSLVELFRNNSATATFAKSAAYDAQCYQQ